MTKRKNLIPSLEMRKHYNTQLEVRIGNEVPDMKLSNHVSGIAVRAQWGHDSFDPKLIVVTVKNKNGNRIRFKEKLYGFPSPELVAKIGLLI